MRIYNLLKEKANSIQYKDRLLYYDLELNRSYSFFDVYNLVNKYVDMFSKLDVKGKKKYLIVDNSVDSIVMFIALIECGVIPVLINKSSLRFNGDYPKDYLEKIDADYDYEELLHNLRYDYLIANNFNTFFNSKEELVKVNSYIDKINNEINSDADFYICTSGSTKGVVQLVPLKDDELVERSINCDRNYSVLTTISISAISGIIYDVYRPIVCDIQNYMSYELFKNNDSSRFLKNIADHRINRVVLPGDILDVLNDDLKKYDFSCVDTAYLTGGLNNEKTINKIKEYLPNLRADAISNMYGRSENYGKISLCRGNKIKSLYVNILESNSNMIIYSFEKKNIYKEYIKNGKRMKEIYNGEYEDIYYANYLSVSENILDNISVNDENIIGEIVADRQNTGDLGLYLDNQLYVIGRKKDLVIIDNKEYYLSMYEQMFSNITGLKTAAIVKDNKIFIVVNYKDDCKLVDNFKRLIPLSKKCNEIVDKLNIPSMYPLFVTPDYFPKSKMLRKTNKIELVNLLEKKEIFQERVSNYDTAFKKIIDDIIAYRYCKKVSTIFKNGEFIFKKSEITFNELIDLGDILGFAHFSEDDENFYVIIDDCILLDKYPSLGFINKEEKIHYMKKQYHVLNKDEFTNFFNKFVSKERNYICFKLFGIISRDDQYITFKPYHLAAMDNYYNDNSKMVGDELPFSRANNESVMMVYLDTANDFYYSDEEFHEKRNRFSLLLNHTYQIKKSNLDFYVDSKIANKDNVIYNDMINENLSFAYRCSSQIACDFSLINLLKKNNVIVLDSEEDVQNVLNNVPSFSRRDFYNDCYLYHLTSRIELSHDEQLGLILHDIIQKAIDNNGNPGIIMYTNYYHQLKLCSNPNMELYNFVKKEVVKTMYSLIQEIRRIGKYTIMVDNFPRIIDLSDIKLIIVDIDDDIFNIDYIFDMIDDCNVIEYKNNKILRKGKYYEY